MSNEIKLKIEVDSASGEAKVKGFTGSLKDMESKGNSSFSNLSFSSDIFTRKLSVMPGLIASAGGALAALGVGALAKDFFDTATSMEKYEVTLTTVLKSADKAKEYMQWIKTFAASTPFEIPELVEASTRLEAYGLSGQKYIGSLGNAASAMGKTLMQAVEMFADASQGEYERLKEFGFRATDVAKQAGFASVQEMNSTRENLAKGSETLIQMLEDRYSGGMERMSKSMSGMMSNLSDSWTSFKQQVMDAGVFEGLTQGASYLLAEIENLKKNGQLDEWAKSVSSIAISAIGGMVEAIGWIPSAYYAAKSAGQEMVSFAAASFSGLIDIVAGVSAGIKGIFNPAWAVEFGLKSAINGLGQTLRDEFPTLASIKDSTDAFGASQANAARESDRSGEKAALLGLKIEQLADKIRNLGKVNTVWEDGSESIIKVDGVYKALGETVQATASVVAESVVAPKVDTSSLDEALASVNRTIAMYDEMKTHIETNPIKMKVEMTGEGSEELPLSEKIAWAASSMDGLSKYITKASPSYTVDMSGFTSSYKKIAEYMAQTEIDLQNYNWTLGGFGNEAIYRGLQNQRTIANEQMDQLYKKYDIMDEINAKLGGIPVGNTASSSSVASSKSFSMGDINITVPQSAEVKTESDWRYIVRQYILPELKAVGA